MSNQENASALGFREFLTTKADEFGVRDRLRGRKEWLDTLNRLLDQLKDWLHQADPEGLLDIEPCEVVRTERGLGRHDAPALQIRFGPSELEVVPMSRDSGRQFEIALDASHSLPADSGRSGR